LEAPEFSRVVDMGDSPQPKPALPALEVPDLELEPVLRPALTKAAAPSSRSASAAQNTGLSLFDDDAFLTGSRTIELGLGGEHHSELDFGGVAAFEPLELEGNAYSGLEPSGRMSSDRPKVSAPQAAGAPWPSGSAPERERIALDPLELSLLAGYGESPKSAYLTPGYAYRVFTRQRELKGLLAPLEAERARAETERDQALAELAHALRPEIERAEQFRRMLSPLVELEQLASQRGQALSSVNAELSTQASELDSELERIAEQLELARASEHDAQRLYDQRDAEAKRAQAKLKRVHIEMRALRHVAEQKLGPSGGEIPEPEASQLATLKQRALAVQPEVDLSNTALEHARVALDRASASVNAADRSERLNTRKKQALAQHYQTEIDRRARGLNESEQQQRKALVEIGRAVLAARGAVRVPESWLERVRSASQRADALLVKCELHLRALDAYDRPKVLQGVRLACTLVCIVLLLILLKIAL
jgi:hypothetical protein